MRIAALPLLCAASAAAQPLAPVNGVDEPPRRGTYVEMGLGLFTAMGGSSTFSSAQPFLALTLGRQIGQRAAVFASIAGGAARASCYQLDATGQTCLAPDSFGATFAEGGVSYGFDVGPRTLLSIRGVAGYTDLSPGPVLHNGDRRAHTPGFHFGGGAGIEYATHLDHFSIGLDALVRHTRAADAFSLTSLSLLPRVRYVF